MKWLAVCVALLLAPAPGFCDWPVRDSAQDQGTGESNGKIEDNLQSVLNADPILSSADVEVHVDDQSITLTGTVDSYAQHQRALQLAQPYAHSRKIVDKIKGPNPQNKYAISAFPFSS